MKFIYVMKSDGGPVKIGIARHPDRRRFELQLGQAFDVSVHHHVAHHDAPEIERVAHQLLEDKRLRGEWFDVTVEEAIEAVHLAIAEVEAGRRAAPLRPSQPQHAGCDLHLRMDEATVTKLHALRRKEADLPSVSEMVRRLIDRAE